MVWVKTQALLLFTSDKEIPYNKVTFLTECAELGKMRSGAARTAGGWSHLREEVVDMPITITLHIFGYTVTIRIKGENRHPGR